MSYRKRCWDYSSHYYWSYRWGENKDWGTRRDTIYPSSPKPKHINPFRALKEEPEPSSLIISIPLLEYTQTCVDSYPLCREFMQAVLPFLQGGFMYPVRLRNPDENQNKRAGGSPHASGCWGPHLKPHGTGKKCNDAGELPLPKACEQCCYPNNKLQATSSQYCTCIYYFLCAIMLYSNCMHSW